MSDVLFTSDLHLDEGLTKVLQLRGFTSPEAHTEAVVSRWEAAVTKRSKVWVLGDLATGSPAHALDVLRGLPGEKHLILGNHDAAHPMHRNAHTHLRRYLDVFASVAMAGRRRIAGEEVLLSHFPYERDHSDPPRHRQWRLRNEGAWLLHGHTHGPEKCLVRPDLRLVAWDGDVIRETRASREIHVGVDAWDFQPVPLDVVRRLIEAASSI